MLKLLHLNNFLLIPSCHIEFEKGFTAITGETGAGKTALTEAIAIGIGARADSSLIRHGQDKAIIELGFEIDADAFVSMTLKEMGIEFDSEELLLIRRELSREGKNRSWINGKIVPLSLLEAIGNSLIQIVDQHTHKELRSLEMQRNILDLFAAQIPQVAEFSLLCEEEKQLQAARETLQEECLKRDSERKKCAEILEELQEAHLKPEEEIELSQEHARLARFFELSEKLKSLCLALSDGPAALLGPLGRIKQLSEVLASIDPALIEANDLLSQAHICAKEAATTFSHYLGRLEHNPKRFVQIEERLSTIERLKHKYGKDLTSLSLFQEELTKKVQELDNLDDRLAEQEKKVSILEQKVNAFAEQLTAARQKSAKVLEAKISKALRLLNMPHAVLSIKCMPSARTKTGDDHVQFWLQANQGEASSPLEACASGGELSRLLLSIKNLLAEKNETPTLIFDEIDANVGGETARLIALQMQDLGQHKQVLCITHFPQVAKEAAHHLCLQKKEEEERTTVSLTYVKNEEREKELLRMMGGLVLHDAKTV